MDINKFIDDLYKTIDNLKIEDDKIKKLIDENIDINIIDELREIYFKDIEKNIKNDKLNNLLKLLGII